MGLVRAKEERREREERDRPEETARLAEGLAPPEALVQEAAPERQVECRLDYRPRTAG